MTSPAQARLLSVLVAVLLPACSGEAPSPRSDAQAPANAPPDGGNDAHSEGDDGETADGDDQTDGDLPDEDDSQTDGGDAGASPDGESRDAGENHDSEADAGNLPEEPPGGGTVTVGEGGVVENTIVVRAGETFDGAGKRYTAGRELGDGSQDENQKPVFRLEEGARLVNVVLGAPAADGIHTYGTVTLKNIVWEDIGEDALTIKAPGTVVLEGGSATNGDDKVFQVNAPSVFRVSDFSASHAGKFIRQNGGTDFKVEVFIERCDISSMEEAIFRTDSDTSTVSMKDSRYSNIGEALFIGVRPENITVAGNSEY
jgi:pectate lyase C